MIGNRTLGRTLTVIAMTPVVLWAGVTGCSKPAPSAFHAPFASDSSWRQPISSKPAIDPNSAAMIAGIQAERALHANLVEFGIPIYQVHGDKPSHAVECTGGDWGACPFGDVSVPIPPDAAPNSGSDGAMVIVDESSSKIYEFWRAAKHADRWSSEWGAVNSLTGSGWGGSSTGSGASRLAGVIRVEEVAAGKIPHALALQTNNACKTSRPPAIKADGTSERPDCIPEGARLQLDPAVDLHSLGLTKGELAVATAMQRYGGYVVDVGGAPLSVSFELDRSAAAGTLGKAYQDAGFRWDYDAMERVPWDKLRVLG
ncbi:hypothetical protein H7J51_19440 [Mycobacterium crocinum]|uniref:Lipoprotein n=1 Tax=Mycolicibacterium crocinum TaxID=388459 RepID=A0ABY3TLK2_9MYCO|nr:hypothetical protein [Mycolicibacterium crocinum]MCV7217454.1 hypothetical protein [Mycolicibacterium crocinum]ULN42341.1 hypothetical protein MI149_04225 [Mycolicibacterium crocinum]